MNALALYVAIGVAVAFLVEGSWLVLASDRGRLRKVRSRLRELQENPGYEAGERRILKERLLSKIPAVHRILLAFPGSNALALDLERAGLPTTVAAIAAWTFAAASVGLLGSLLTGIHFGPAMVVATFLAVLPVSWVWFQKVERRRKFSTQLPEAIDLLVRSLKAGHSLSSGFRLVGDELSDPIAREFTFVHEEMNLGRDFEEALENLAERIDTPDVHLVVTSMLIQRETGGNLVEILENIAAMVRRRETFAQKLKSITAEGRLSGGILVSLPPVMVLVLLALNREYAHMLSVPELRIFLVLAAILQVAGVVWIRRIVSVRY